MDISFYVLVFAILGLLVGLASAALGRELFAWFVCLPTSVAYIMLPFVLAPHLEVMLKSLGSILQPHFAYTVLNLWLLLCILFGITGIVICIVTAIAWFRKKLRTTRP